MGELFSLVLIILLKTKSKPSPVEHLSLFGYTGFMDFPINMMSSEIIPLVSKNDTNNWFKHPQKTKNLSIMDVLYMRKNYFTR